MPQRTAFVSRARPDLRRYDRLIATMRNASSPSRSVMTRACSMDEARCKMRPSLRMRAQCNSVYPTGQVGIQKKGLDQTLRTSRHHESVAQHMITIIAIGDSTTAGTPGFRSPLEAPPKGSGNVESQYAHWLMTAHPDWRVLDRGVNGGRSDQVRARLTRGAVTPAPPWPHRASPTASCPLLTTSIRLRTATG